MREINGNRDCIFLGHEQDNESLAVKFNVQKFYNACGKGGQFHLRHRRAVDPDAYPVPASQVELDGHVLTWIVRAEDLVRGEGLLQIKYYDGDVVLMSEIHKTLCNESLGTSTTPPSPWTGYIDEIEQYAGRAEEAVNHYPYIDPENNNWFVWDSTLQEFVDTGIYAGGNDDKNYIHNQSTASARWVVVHNLNKYPSVSITDSAGSQVFGEVQYVDENNLIITFSAAFSGKAYMN